MSTPPIVGYCKIPALDDELCKNCGAANHGSAYSVWRVAYSDDRPLVFECDACGHSWAFLSKPPAL